MSLGKFTKPDLHQFTLTLSEAFVIQKSRFMIVEEVGCSTDIVNVGLSLLITSSAPLLFSLLSLTMYSRTFFLLLFLFVPIIYLTGSPQIARLIWIYFQHRKLDEILDCSPINRLYFSKLLALGSFDALIMFPNALRNLVTPLFYGGGVSDFWIGWRAVHANISDVPKVTSGEWKSAGWCTILEIRCSQWLSPLFGVVFFALFGLTEKNRIWYRDIFRKMMKPFGFTSRQNPTASTFICCPGPVPSCVTST